MKIVDGLRVKGDDERDDKRSASNKARRGASDKAVKPVTSARVKGDDDAGDTAREG